jgi:hypothetical protein
LSISFLSLTFLSHQKLAPKIENRHQISDLIDFFYKYSVVINVSYDFDSQLQITPHRFLEKTAFETSAAITRQDLPVHQIGLHQHNPDYFVHPLCPRKRHVYGRLLRLSDVHRGKAELLTLPPQMKDNTTLFN